MTKEWEFYFPCPTVHRVVMSLREWLQHCRMLHNLNNIWLAWLVTDASEAPVCLVCTQWILWCPPGWSLSPLSPLPAGRVFVIRVRNTPVTGCDDCIYRQPSPPGPGHRPDVMTRAEGRPEFLITKFNGTFSLVLRHPLWLIQTRKLLRRDSRNMTKSLVSPETWRVFVPIVCIKTKWQEIKSITT